MARAVGENLSDEVGAEIHTRENAGYDPHRQAETSRVRSHGILEETLCMPESLQERINRLIKERGMNHTSVALTAGLGRSAIRDIVRGKSRRPSYDTLKKIADALGIHIELLTDTIVTPSKILHANVITGRDPRSPRTGVPAGDPLRGPVSDRTLPVFGQARGGLEGEFFMTVETPPIDWSYRPPQLAHVDNAYAVLMTGTSMEPRFQEGCILWIHPGLPTPVGKDVLVTLKDDRAFVKRLVKKTATHLIVAQFGDEPGELPPIPIESVRSIHRIVGSWDG
jgi:phage repressor protein C with HTH and peptisase S24 domain